MGASRVVGLTGGIASGKSTVARLLARHGATVIDADAIVHELQAPGGELLAAMVEAFGSEILAADGSLERKALGERVFADPAARRRLEALVHPQVGAEMGRRLARARDSGAPLVVLDIPLLLEGRSALALDAVIVVWVPRETQIERQIARDGCSPLEAERRVASQRPLDEKRALADHVIDNSGRPEETATQVEALYRRLTSPAEAAP